MCRDPFFIYSLRNTWRKPHEGAMCFFAACVEKQLFSSGLWGRYHELKPEG